MARRIRWLFSPADIPISARGAISWWEERRLIYNICVFSVGAVAFIVYCVTITLSGELKYGEDVIEPMAIPVGIVVVPIAVNFFYSFGGLIEGGLRLLSKSRIQRFGPVLFGVGLVFSLLLVSAPAWLWLAIVAGLIGT